MVSEVSRDLKVKRVKMAFQDSKVTWVLKVTEARWVKLAQEEKMALKAPKGVQAQLETLAPLAKQERRENLGFQDCQAIREDKVQRVPLDFLDFQVLTARKVLGVSLANQAPEVNVVQRVLAVPEAPEVPRENLGQRVLRVVMALLALQVKEALKDLRVQLDSLDQKALLVLLGRMDYQDTLDSVEKLDFKAKQVPLGQEVWLDHRDRLVKLVQ